MLTAYLLLTHADAQFWLAHAQCVVAHVAFVMGGIFFCQIIDFSFEVYNTHACLHPII